MRTILSLLLLATVLLPTSTASADSKRVVKVFVLAGQSNMVGQAKNTLLEHQAVDPKTKKLFAHLRTKDGWAERDDVFIKFFERHGPLTIGYGGRNKTGLELEFGTVMGEHFKGPVLLIKVAWGGRSIVRDFRSPSAGMPSKEALAEELTKAQTRVERENKKHGRNKPLPTMDDIVGAYGKDYRAMIAEVQSTLSNAGTLFPALKRKKLELAGFVWFQGWNDQYGGQDTYQANLEHLIRDVRKDLGVKDLPVVIGVMGQNGSKPAKGTMATIQQAQLAMEKVKDFKGNVRSVRTDELVDRDAEALFPRWKQEREAWERTGSDRPYHYLGSAIWFGRIGRAFAEAMLAMRAK